MEYTRQTLCMVTPKAVRLILGTDICEVGPDDSDSDDVPADGDETDGEWSKDDSCNVDLKEFLWFFRRTTRSSIERFVTQEDAHLRLNKEEVEGTEANMADLDIVTYMDGPALEFKNASTRAGVAICSPWMPLAMVSQPVDDGSICKGQISPP